MDDDVGGFQLIAAATDGAIQDQDGRMVQVVVLAVLYHTLLVRWPIHLYRLALRLQEDLISPTNAGFDLRAHFPISLPYSRNRSCPMYIKLSSFDRPPNLSGVQTVFGHTLVRTAACLF